MESHRNSDVESQIQKLINLFFTIDKKDPFLKNFVVLFRLLSSEGLVSYSTGVLQNTVEEDDQKLNEKAYDISLMEAYSCNIQYLQENSIKFEETFKEDIDCGKLLLFHNPQDENLNIEISFKFHKKDEKILIKNQKKNQRYWISLLNNIPYHIKNYSNEKLHFSTFNIKYPIQSQEIQVGTRYSKYYQYPREESKGLGFIFENIYSLKESFPEYLYGRDRFLYNTLKITHNYHLFIVPIQILIKEANEEIECYSLDIIDEIHNRIIYQFSDYDISSPFCFGEFLFFFEHERELEKKGRVSNEAKGSIKFSTYHRVALLVLPKFNQNLIHKDYDIFFNFSPN